MMALGESVIHWNIIGVGETYTKELIIYRKEIIIWMDQKIRIL